MVQVTNETVPAQLQLDEDLNGDQLGTGSVNEGSSRVRQAHLPSTKDSRHGLRRCRVCDAVRVWHKHAGQRPVRCDHCDDYTEHDWEFFDIYLTNVWWYLRVLDRLGVRVSWCDSVSTPVDGQRRVASMSVRGGAIAELAMVDTLPPWRIVEVIETFMSGLFSAQDSYGDHVREVPYRPSDRPIVGWRVDSHLLHRLDGALTDDLATGVWVDGDQLRLDGPCPCGGV